MAWAGPVFVCNAHREVRELDGRAHRRGGFVPAASPLVSSLACRPLRLQSSPAITPSSPLNPRRYYQECFGMKLLRFRDIPEVGAGLLCVLCG